MNLFILDADSKNSYTSKDISSLLGTADLTVWQLNDQELADNDYHLDAVTGVQGSFSRVVLLTQASYGIMNYHRKMIRSNPMVKYWIITITAPMSATEQQQILLEVSEIFQQQNLRYAVLFDDPQTLKGTASMIAETVPEKPQCVLFYTRETQTAAQIIQSLHTAYPDWDVLCNPGDTDWVEKYADRILLFAEDLERFAFLAKINNPDRIYTWVEAEPGTVSQQKEKIVHDTSCLMADCGFSLTQKERHILCGFSQYELFRAEIAAGAYSCTALKTNDAFVMWDEYGLPLLNRQYEENTLKHFLDEHCVLADFIDQ